MYLNIEIKAICKNPGKIRQYLLNNQGDFRGTDYQKDTYFNVPRGRLKLRQGNIENNLIFYEREDKMGPKSSNFNLVKIEDTDGLKTALVNALGVMKVVEKHREIYYINNVKFHIDDVQGLGTFVEIEAGNLMMPKITIVELKEQCRFYMEAFEIKDQDLITNSYSDMLN